MTGSGKVLLALCGCLLVSAVAASGSAALGTTTAAVARPAVVPDVATKAMVEKACSDCHKFTQVSAQHKNADQWGTVVGRMIAMGAPVSDADAPRVVAYLASNYGPVASGTVEDR